MGLISNLKARFDRKPLIGSSIRVMEGSGWNGEKPWPFDYCRAVEQCRGWVYRCAFGNAEAAASVPLRLYVRKRSARTLKMLGAKGGYVPYTTRPISRKQAAWLRGDADNAPSLAVVNKIAEFGDEFEEVVDHPALQLLRKANPYMNGYDTTVLRFVMQELTGNAYQHVVMDRELDRPVELWPLLSQWTWIVPGDQDGEELVKGYAYGQQADQRVVFEPGEVLHFKTSSLSDLMYGFGKVEAAWSALGLHHSERVMQRSFFDNRARPDFLLSVDGADNAQVERVQSKVQSLLRGVRSAGKFLTVGGKTTLTPINFNPKDIGTDENIIEEIAGVFGYPVTKLKANDPNRSNAETGNAGWLRDTILPILTRDEEALNQNGYLGLFGGGALLDEAVLAYDNPVPADRKLELAESRTLVASGLRTPDEDRALRGEQPLPNGVGEMPRVNGQRLDLLDKQAEQPTADPLAGLFGSPKTYLTTGERVAARSWDDAEAVARQQGVELVGELVGEVKRHKADEHDEQDWPEEVKGYRVKVEGLESDLADTARGEEPASPAIDIYRAVRRIMAQQTAEVIAAMRGGDGKAYPRRKATDADVPDLDAIMRRYNDDLATDLADAMRRAMQAGGEAGLDRIGVGGGFDVTSDAVREAMESQAQKLARDINAETGRVMRRTIANGLDAGDDLRSIADRLEGDSINAVRAERIARTESARGYVQGQQAAWKESGVVGGKKWLLAPGACPVCKAVAQKVNAGDPVPIDKPFFKKGDSITGADGRVFKFDYTAVDGPPAHVNCRCDTLPVLN